MTMLLSVCQVQHLMFVLFSSKTLQATIAYCTLLDCRNDLCWKGDSKRSKVAKIKQN